MPGHGTFCWNELITSDVEGAKRFYEETVGWSFSQMPMPGGTYHLASVGGQPVAGIVSPVDLGLSGVPPVWFAYLEVDNIDERLARARAAGATVTREPFDVDGIGRIAILRQPDGATVGWMSPAAQS